MTRAAKRLRSPKDRRRRAESRKYCVEAKTTALLRAPRPEGGSRANRIVRLSLQGRSGQQWTYSAPVIASSNDFLEVSTFVPILVGVRVKVCGTRDDVNAGAWACDAQVNDCRCGPDGLFRLALALDDESRLSSLPV